MSKKQPKLTPWFPADVKPAYIGGYEFKYSTGYQFDAWWDGGRWLINDKKCPPMSGKVVFYFEEALWRGLAVKP